MGLQKILNRGDAAKKLLEYKIFAEAVNEVRSGLLEEIVKTKLKDSEGREKAYMAIRALDDVVGKLNSYVSEADFAKQKAKEKKVKEAAK